MPEPVVKPAHLENAGEALQRLRRCQVDLIKQNPCALAQRRNESAFDKGEDGR